MAKNRLIKTSSYLFILSLLVFAAVSCKKLKDPTEGAKLIVDYNLIHSTVSLKFIDASTGELIGAADDSRVSITITGENAGDVVDIMGTQDPDNEYLSRKGFFSCGLPDAVVPSLASPVEFTIVAEMEGYLPTSLPIMLTEKTDMARDVYMVNINDPVSGMSVQWDYSGSASNGVVNTDITVTTPDVIPGNMNASLFIPQGVVLKDGGGNPLNGNLTTKLVYFSNLDDESLSAFPGGLVVNTSTAPDPAMAFNAGFAYIEIMDGSGKKAATMEGGKGQLSMGVSGQTYNSEKGGPVAAGDEVPFWHYNSNTGSWDSEGTSVFQSSNRSDFIIIADISLFDYFSFFWLLESICYEGSTFVFQSDSYSCENVFLKARVREKLTGNDNVVLVLYMYVEMNTPYQLRFMPGNLPVEVEFEVPCTNTHTEMSSYFIQSLCSPETFTINLISDPTTYVVGSVSGYCEDSPDIVVRPTVGAWFRHIDESCWRYAYMTNGYARICDVYVGETYVVGFYFDGEWEEFEVFVEEQVYIYEDVELTYDICDNLGY